MTVWVLYDIMNEEVVGVFSSSVLAERARNADPQSNTYLGVDEFELDRAVVRSQ